MDTAENNGDKQAIEDAEHYIDAKTRQLCPEWDLVNEIFAEKDGGDEELRTGTSNSADITLGAPLDGEAVARGRGDPSLPPGTQQASRQQSPMSSQDDEDTLSILPPPFNDPFDPSQSRLQSNSQDGARTPSLRERTSGMLRHAFMAAIFAAFWYRLTP